MAIEDPAFEKMQKTYTDIIELYNIHLCRTAAIPLLV